ncbi:MAG TPA: GH1 family beta-glucosidase [Micromonosporaceae bacterium]|jgi:beta-glucosidase
MTTEALTVPSVGQIRRVQAPFRWGVATSAYQIEGAVAEDGRTPSIWDTYCQVPGAIDGGDNGDVACDHYHRMPEDVDLIADLGVDTYRFSVSWPRVQPGGRGPVNPGMGFYDRLVDEVLSRGVEPWLTLYHWDLPQELEDAGGWPNRDTAERFADYSMLVFDALSDRVKVWTTMNEPWCSAMLGYAYGRHAPGRTDFAAGIHAAHHLMLGHGLATQRMRAAATAADRDLEFGITLNLGNAIPHTDSHADHEASRRADGLGARLYLDPLLRGRYPSDVVADLAARGVEIPVRDGDLEAISTPIDVLGVNFYSDSVFSGVDEAGHDTDSDGHPIERRIPRGLPVTAMDWEIRPDGLSMLLKRLGDDYPGTPLVITESGAAFADAPDDKGYVADGDRTAYLAAYLDAVADAQEAGVDVRGYFAWSLLDNFEWGYGYDKRFGLIRVDYDTQVRTPKQSAHWFRDAIATWRSA